MKLRTLLAALAALALPAVLIFAVLGGNAPLRAAENESLAQVATELQEPADVMLTRQLFGSDPSLLPHNVFASAKRQRARLTQATAQRAPGIAEAQWGFQGPTNIGGRILDLAVDPQLPDTIYAAAASGGLWKSSDAGKTFQPAWPEELTQAVGAVAMTPGGVLYVGTGESGPGGGGITYGGDGVYRSDDRGKTWRRVGLERSSRISRIVIDPTNEKRIFVAATGPLFKAGGERGLFRSDDGGESWKLVLEGDNATTGASDIAIDPKDPKVVWATTWDHIREPDVRRYEGTGSGVYKSTDGGDTFRRVGTPFLGPSPHIGRIGIAIAPGNTNTVYTIVSTVSGGAGGFYKTTDGGTTWSPRHAPPLLTGALTYGWWFGRLWVDPDDDDRVWVAGVNMSLSNDGGTTWSATGSFHADQHAMAWDPKVPNRVYLGNDGGVYRSDDDGINWEFAEHQPFSQLWAFDVSREDPTRFVAGLQDNGCWKSWGGDDATQWSGYGCGDGLRTLVKPGNQKTIYGCSQYGACFINRNEGRADSNESFENRVVSSRKGWLTPVEFDPKDPDVVYTGGEIMSRSDDDAETWTPISPDLSNGPGRETNPLFKNYGTLTSIAPGPRSSGTIYAGTDDGNFQYTHNGGLTWTKVAGGTGESSLPAAWVTRVEIDPADTQTVYVTYSGFRSGDDAAYILRSKDGGQTFENLTGDLPRTPLNDVNLIGKDIVVAGDMGVFLSRDDGRTWLKVGRGLPLVPIHELQYDPARRRLFVGTFGRGIYSVDYAAIDRAPVVPGGPTIKPPPRTNLGLPSRRRCGRALRFKVRGAKSLRSLTIHVGKRKVKTLRGRALRRTVTLKLTSRKVKVTLRAVTRGGKRLSQSRTYKACPKRRR